MYRGEIFAWAMAILLGTVAAPSAGMQETSSPPGKVADRLARGREMLAAGRPADALVAFTRASKAAGSGSVEAWLGIAEAARRTGDYERTVAAAREAERLALTPQERVRALNLRGMGLIQLQVVGPRLGNSRTPKTQSDASAHEKPPPEQQEAEAAFRLALELSRGAANGVRYNLADAISWWIETVDRHREALALLDEFVARGPEPGQAKEAKELRAWLECVGAPDAEAPIPAGAFDETRIKPPRKIRSMQPEYTTEARQAGVQGTMLLRAIIDKEGRIACAEVARGLAHGLDAVALEAVRDWRFEPATLDGQPVAVHFNLTINFWLERR